jgi:predicted phage tail protein
MGWEHEAETVWRAQELYCVDRLSFDAVARETGVAASTLKRWAEKYCWQAKREEIAKAEADIRADKVLARAAMLKALIATKDPQTGFAVSSLETLAMKEAEVARQGAIRAVANDQTPAFSVNTPADVIAALRKAIEQKLALLLTRPENVDLRSVQEVQKCLALVGLLEAAQTAAQPESKGTEGGLPADFVDQIKRVMSGGA